MTFMVTLLRSGRVPVFIMFNSDLHGMVLNLFMKAFTGFGIPG